MTHLSTFSRLVQHNICLTLIYYSHLLLYFFLWMVLFFFRSSIRLRWFLSGAFTFPNVEKKFLPWSVLPFYYTLHLRWSFLVEMIHLCALRNDVCICVWMYLFVVYVCMCMCIYRCIFDFNHFNEMKSFIWLVCTVRCFSWNHIHLQNLIFLHTWPKSNRDLYFRDYGLKVVHKKIWTRISVASYWAKSRRLV